MATAIVSPVSIVSIPSSSQRLSAIAMASRSLMPQFAPMRASVSYSRAEVKYFPSPSTYTFEHLMAHPGWHGCPERPPRSAMSLERVSPEIASASSNRPELKLRVGNPPRRLIVFTRLAVPYVVNVFFALLIEIAQSLATRRSSLLPTRLSVEPAERRGGSSTIAFIPLLPRTAPSPPRPACLLGYPWVSVTAIVAIGRSLSPAGPTDITVTCEPNSSLRLFTKS